MAVDRQDDLEAPEGTYKLVIRPRHRGVLHLRLDTPDPATYHVALTVI